MISRADLHLHTTYSDGQLPPSEIVRLSAARGLKVIAITDHNTTDGLTEALMAALRYHVQVIPGLELTTKRQGVHVLGYFLDHRLPWLQSELARLRQSQQQSIRKTVERLEALGIYVRWERVLQLAGDGSVGRRHIALAMLENGYVSSVDEAFGLYLGHDGSVRTEMTDNLAPAEAAAIIVRADGFPVLAHPADLSDVESLVFEVKKAGLVGLEVYYRHYDEETVVWLLGLARRHRLLALGGSDYHGSGEADERLPGDVPLPLGPVRKLMLWAHRRSEGCASAGKAL